MDMNFSNFINKFMIMVFLYMFYYGMSIFILYRILNIIFGPFRNDDA